MKTKLVLSVPKETFLSGNITTCGSKVPVRKNRTHGSCVPTIVLIILLSLNFCLLSSQVPQGFTYQAIARDGSGNALVNQSLPVRITIQSDSLSGTTFWIEEHSSVTTNNLGLFTLILGKGVKQAGSAVSAFKDIDWSVIPKFIKTEINYGGWKYMGTSRLWSVPYSMVAGDLNDTLKKLVVKGQTDVMDEALFEVKNKNGQTVFAVYNEGVRIYVDDGKTKGATKGGFAIGGFVSGKTPGQEYLRVTRDSTRIYVNDDVTKGATKGGFAIGGFDTGKAPGQEYLRVTPDSTRVYVNNNGIGKGTSKGGFAIGGFDQAKTASEEYLRVTSDSVKVSKSLLIPRLTTYERDNLSFIPGEALIIFNMTEGCMQIFKNNVWSNIWCFNCAPAFIIQPVDKTICSGETAVFFISATGTSLSYQWQQSIDNGSTWNSISNGGSSPAISGAQAYTLTLLNVPVEFHNYKLRCIAAGSCLPNVISNAVTLYVGSTPPVITSQPTDQQLSAGCTANFNILSPGYSVSYKWQQSTDEGTTWNNISNGGTNPVFSGSTTSALSLSNVPWLCNNYKYRCIVSNLCGADATSDAATLTISPSSIITQPANQQLTTGCDANFSIATPAGYVVLYQWQASADGGGIWGNISEGGTSPIYSGVNISTLNLSNVPLSCNNYQYRCVVTSICGPNETSDAATLTIAQSSIVTQPSNQQLSDGCDASFSITTPAGYVISYQWETSTDGGSTWNNISNGGSSPVYSGVTTPTLTLSYVPLSYNNYQYRCIVSSLCGPNETSNSSTLTVNTSPIITIQPINRLVYNKGNIDFNVTTSGSGFNYQWQVSTNGGDTWTNVLNGGSNPAYSGVNTSGLSLTNVPLSFNDYKYRCVVSHNCRPDAISDAVTLSVPTPAPVTDIDGNTYNTVGINTQLWMAENLKTTKYNNGDLIGTTTPPSLAIITENAPKYQWAFAGDEDNVTTYGRLYTWYTVTDSRSVCPTGWHVPSLTEWTALTAFLGENFAANKLKEAGLTHWAPPLSEANNETGFTALPGGMRDPLGTFYEKGENGYWYTSTESTFTQACFAVIYSGITYVGIYGHYLKHYGYSVRCVKN